MNYKRYFRLYKNIIFSTLIILFCAIIGLFVLTPFFTQLLSLRDKVIALQADVDILEQKISILDSIDDSVLREHLLSLDAAVPTHKSLPTLLGTIDGLNLRSGLSLENVAIESPGKLSTSSALLSSVTGREIHFSFAVRGTIEQIRSFLELTTKIKRVLRIDSLAFSFPDSSVGNIQLSMSTFYEPLESFSDVVEKPIKPFTDEEARVLVAVAAMPWYAEQLESLPPEEYPTRNDPFYLEF